MATETAEKVSYRQKEIVKKYLFELDKHIADLKSGKAETAYEIRDLASLLHIHPRHLSNTIQQVLGVSPCDIYEQKLMTIAKELLLTSKQSIAQIARHLTFDPSNFTKFFKRFEGVTPKEFRKTSKI